MKPAHRFLLLTSTMLLAVFCVGLSGDLSAALAQNKPPAEKPEKKGPPPTPPPPPAEPPKPALDRQGAVLRALDKVTGRTATFTAKVGSDINFGRLKIHIHRCQQSPPGEIPEQAVFLHVVEKLSKSKTEKQVFSGWMFASNPALSAMEHPTYDVWLLACKKSSSAAAVKKRGK